MPIIEITANPLRDKALLAKMIADLRRTGAAALECEPGNIWVVFHGMPEGHYTEAPDPIVTIRANVGRSGEQKKAFVKAAASVIALALTVSESRVWVHYLEMNPKDIWFNGNWTGKSSD